MKPLSKKQWMFLGLVESFTRPVSIDLAARLVPLTPGALIGLLEAAESQGWIFRSAQNELQLQPRIPQDAIKKMRSILNKEHMSQLLDVISAEKLASKIDPLSLARMMRRAQRWVESGRMEVKLANAAIKKKEYEKGRASLLQAVSDLGKNCRDNETRTLFIQTVLRLLNLSIALGKGLFEEKVEYFLNQALEMTERTGDSRSRAILNLHLGKLYYLSDRRDEALVALSIGADEIEALGDEDIRHRSAGFLGMYHYIRGEFKPAFEHLEKAVIDAENTEDSIFTDPVAPVFFGYCAIYLGQFHRAIGHLDYYLRLAVKQSDKALASTIRAVLGTVLILLKKDREAGVHLDRSGKDATDTGNALGMYLWGGGKALSHFLNSDMDNAYNILSETAEKGARAGFISQFSSPWILEMLYEFHCLGYPPIPVVEYKSTVKKIMEGTNCHLQGVCLRLMAKAMFGQSGTHLKIEQYLEDSEKKLRQSGDPVQTSKTLLEISRLKHIQGHRDIAAKTALVARQMLGGYIDEFFPDEPACMLEIQRKGAAADLNEDTLIDRYLEMIESFYPAQNRVAILSKMLAATSQMFGAERSGIFWFPESKFTAKPELETALNLPKIEINTPQFKKSIRAVCKAFKNNQPVIEEIVLKERSLGKVLGRSVLCIPIEVNGLASGVLYYDNSYLDNAFEFLNLSLIKRLARHTNIVVERHMDHLKTQNRETILRSEKERNENLKRDPIITRSKELGRILAQVDKVAKTDSTVLILGETGTGKELVANRIHKKSLRSDRPFIVVDSTTIADNLLESELFGHEKGAFTGADKRKIGCIEMANNGTLFLDEVGELPLGAQAKLLRALQEKTIRRVGGLTGISTDFRLVAATNRDLSLEVEKGRFREDLFYRLNIVPFTLPPLRERKSDLMVLAEHFIFHYAKKYNFPHYNLSEENRNKIQSYSWPGNVRELKNVMERAVLLSEGDRLNLDLPLKTRQLSDDPFDDLPTLQELQCRYIRHVIDRTNGKISGPDGACEILGLKRTSFYSKMRSLGFRRNKV